jgi:hypothetical protein
MILANHSQLHALEFKQSRNKCTVRNEQHMCRTWFEFTYSQKQNPYDPTEAAVKFVVKKA